MILGVNKGYCLFKGAHFADVRSFMRQVWQVPTSSRRTFSSVDVSHVVTRTGDSSDAGKLMDAKI